MSDKDMQVGKIKQLTQSEERLNSELERYKEALSELCCCKVIKDEQGKCPEYLRRQPKAWKAAFELIQNKKVNSLEQKLYRVRQKPVSQRVSYLQGHAAGRKEQMEVVAQYIMNKGLATGHGDTIEDMLDEFVEQVREK